MNPSLYDIFAGIGAGANAASALEPKGERDPGLVGLGAGLSAFGAREPTRATPGDWLPVVAAGILVTGVAIVGVTAIVLLRR